MLFENLPSELLLEIFSYLPLSDLYTGILPLSKIRFSYLIFNEIYSLDLTYISYSNFSLILTTYSPSKLVFLRLTNQYSHGLLISEFFSAPDFHPTNFLSLRSLHLSNMIGNEFNCLPPNLHKLYVHFHKKAKYASKFYQLALQSTSLKQCYLIGGYAFDSKTCFPIGSNTIEHLHVAIKSFPNDLIVLLQNLPALTKLKTKLYSQTINNCLTLSSTKSCLRHMNIDLQGSGISLFSFDKHILSYLFQLKSLIYHASNKSSDDFDCLVKYSTKLRRFHFIQKGFSVSNFDQRYFHLQQRLAFTAHELNHTKISTRTMNIHTIPYPESNLCLPLIQWNCFPSDVICDENVYNRVERVRFNLSIGNSQPLSYFPQCRNVNNLTLISNETIHLSSLSLVNLSSYISLSKLRHLILNTQLNRQDLEQLFSSMSLHSLDINYSQLHSNLNLSTIKNLSLINEPISSEDIDYLIQCLIPHLEHLQMIVKTSFDCQQVLDSLLSLTKCNRLISIKICICQTLSDEIERDLQPKFSSNQWIPVKYQMDSWYLYIWK